MAILYCLKKDLENTFLEDKFEDDSLAYMVEYAELPDEMGDF